MTLREQLGRIRLFEPMEPDTSRSFGAFTIIKRSTRPELGIKPVDEIPDDPGRRRFLLGVAGLFGTTAATVYSGSLAYKATLLGLELAEEQGKNLSRRFWQGVSEEELEKKVLDLRGRFTENTLDDGLYVTAKTVLVQRESGLITFNSAKRVEHALREYAKLGTAMNHIVAGDIADIVIPFEGERDARSVIGELSEISGHVRLPVTLYREGSAVRGWLQAAGYVPEDAEKVSRLPYGRIINAAAERYKVDPLLLAAVVGVESGYNAMKVSTKGAQGLCQLMPDTADRFNVEDCFNAWENAMAGAKYLNWLMDRFDGDVMRALSGYNAGEGHVDKGRHVRFGETREYVHKVMELYRDFVAEEGFITYAVFRDSHERHRLAAKRHGGVYLA